MNTSLRSLISSFTDAPTPPFPPQKIHLPKADSQTLPLASQHEYALQRPLVYQVLEGGVPVEGGVRLDVSVEKSTHISSAIVVTALGLLPLHLRLYVRPAAPVACR